VTATIAGPRTEAQWDGYAALLSTHNTANCHVHFAVRPDSIGWRPFRSFYSDIS
jgi:hypothetical protein